MELKPGYKLTEVGVIPEEWDTATIGSLISDFRGGAPLKPSDFTQMGITVVSKGGVIRGGRLVIDDKDLQFCSEAYAARHSTNYVDRKYTIVVLKDLVPSGPNIGLMVQIESDETHMLAQGVYGFQVNQEKADSGYLIQLSNTSSYRRLMNGIMVGST